MPLVLKLCRFRLIAKGKANKFKRWNLRHKKINKKFKKKNKKKKKKYNSSDFFLSFVTSLTGQLLVIRKQK
jgi:hypothetical protein